MVVFQSLRNDAWPLLVHPLGPELYPYRGVSTRARCTLSALATGEPFLFPLFCYK